jgi:hypothetical protein
MTNTQSNEDLIADTLHEFTAPVRDLIANVREMEARFCNASETIRRIRPGEKIGNFPSLEGIETMGSGDLGIRECFAKLAVHAVERRSDELLAEAEEAERVRAESLRRQNMGSLEARIEKLERALAYQGAEIAKLKGVHNGQLPALPHVSRSQVPQFLGMPGGMGRPPVGQAAGSGVRKLGTNGSVSEPDTAGAGFTRRIHPLNVIGGR